MSKPANPAIRSQKDSGTVGDGARANSLRDRISHGSMNDPDFDNLMKLSSETLDGPIAFLILKDRDELWVHSRVGIAPGEVAVNGELWSRVISRGETLIVSDASKDVRFDGFSGKPPVRFVAAHPVNLRGERIGALCVIDTKPRAEVSTRWHASLKRLADLASSLLGFKYGMQEVPVASPRRFEREMLDLLASTATEISNWVWRPGENNFDCDLLMRQQLGFASNGPVGLDAFINVIDPQYQPEFRSVFGKEYQPGEEFDIEFAARRGRQWFRMRGKPDFHGGTGQGVPLIGVLVDITERKTFADNTRKLLKELNHRVKNTLAILQALSAQTLRGTASGNEYRTVFFGRLQAISRVHSILSGNDWRGVGLRAVVAGQLEEAFSENSDITIDLPEVELTPDQGLGIGLIFHELRNNAFEHGSLTVDGGRVDVSGKVAGETPRMLKLKWIERGGREPRAEEEPDARSGLTLVTRALDKVLGSKVEISREKAGMEVDISFPL